MKFLALTLLASISTVAVAYPDSSLDSSTYVSDSSIYGSNSNSSDRYRSTSYNNIGNNTYGSDGSSYRSNGNYTYGTSPNNLGESYRRSGNTTYGTGYDNRGYSSTRISPNSSVTRDQDGNIGTCINIGNTVTCN
ncbi:hypothetical protein [Acinetobacter baumannii]|uniref:hypothetical protein n=1 Tax=Acinetobacter baumannii TaxID=470 RepID=UPI0022EC3CDA|nr:hypothetical protein [Acinetobacter baumannii]